LVFWFLRFFFFFFLCVCSCVWDERCICGRFHSLGFLRYHSVSQKIKSFLGACVLVFLLPHYKLQQMTTTTTTTVSETTMKQVCCIIECRVCVCKLKVYVCICLRKKKRHFPTVYEEKSVQTLSKKKKNVCTHA